MVLAFVKRSQPFRPAEYHPNSLFNVLPLHIMSRFSGGKLIQFPLEVTGRCKPADNFAESRITAFYIICKIPLFPEPRFDHNVPYRVPQLLGKAEKTEHCL
jgi:hypothetical protein